MDSKIEHFRIKTPPHALRASSRTCRTGMPWRSEQTFRLIELYQSMPCLWDGRSEAYKNRKMRHDARQALANEFGVDVYEVEKKLQSLKSQFRREHKKLRDARKNGHGVKECAWFGYEPLMFLLQADGPRSGRGTREENHLEYKLDPGVNHLNNGYNDDEDMGCDLMAEELPGFPNEDSRTPTKCIPNSVRKRLEMENGEADEAYKVMETVMANAANRDEYAVYGEHVGNKLRNCGRQRHDLAVAQHKIDDILFRLEMGAFAKRNYDARELDSPSPSPGNPSSPFSNVDFLPVESVLEDPACGDPPVAD